VADELVDTESAGDPRDLDPDSWSRLDRLALRALKPGARVTWGNDSTFAGEVLGPCPGYPGFTIIIWDNYPRSVLHDSVFGHSLLPEGECCYWCWGDMGGVTYTVLGQDFCSTGCHDLYKNAQRLAIARHHG
jgi:hypothetical protein